MQRPREGGTLGPAMALPGDSLWKDYLCVCVCACVCVVCGVDNSSLYTS